MGLQPGFLDDIVNREVKNSDWVRSGKLEVRRNYTSIFWLRALSRHFLMKLMVIYDSSKMLELQYYQVYFSISLNPFP